MRKGMIWHLGRIALFMLAGGREKLRDDNYCFGAVIVPELNSREGDVGLEDYMFIPPQTWMV